MISCRRNLIVLFLLSALYGQAQEANDSLQVRNQVYEFLTQEPQAVDDALELLRISAWEALAYLEASENPQAFDLQEAVPDYYHFKRNTLVIKLIDPETNEYGVNLTAAFRISENSRVQLIDLNTGEVRDEWVIIGLDKNYLALDMGEIKVFFTHTSAQE